jgi:hypothetical protein
MVEGRTEKDVLQDLSPEQLQLLKRVLQIESSKLHVSGYDATDDLVAAVKEIIP